MNVFALLFVILLLAITAILTFFNIDPVTITVWHGQIYELPKIGLILIPFGAGAILVFCAYLVRDARKYIEGWKDTKIKKKQARIQDLYSKGANALLAGQYSDAREFFTKLLEEDPVHGYALMRRGEVALHDGQTEDAVDYFTRARDGEPRNLEILFGLARGFEAAGKQEDAMGIYDRILRMDENNLAALVGKRTVFERLDRWEEVNDLQRKIIKLQSDSRGREREQKNLLGYRYELGRSHLEAGQLDKAIKDFRTTLKLDRQFVPGHLGQAEARLRQDQTDKAVETLEKSYHETGSLTILVRLEDLFLGLGDPNRIIALYQKALASDPLDQRLQFFLGKLYYRLEMLDDAFELLKRIDTAGEHYPHLSKLLGNIYLRRGNAEEAAAAYRKAMRWNKRLMVPYCCSACGYRTNDWSGRCTQCGRWDTYTLSLAYRNCGGKQEEEPSATGPLVATHGTAE